MKLKFYALIAGVALSLLVAIPASATLISYNNISELQAAFENDSDYVFSEFNLKHLSGGSEWFELEYDNSITLHDKSLSGAGIVTINFPSPNTTFGATWIDVVQGSTTFTAYGADGTVLDTFVIPESKINPRGKSLPQFFGVRGGEGELVSMVEVELGGASMRQLVHNHPAVPEPATMLLLGSGLIGLGVVGRKKFFKK